MFESLVDVRKVNETEGYTKIGYDQLIEMADVARRKITEDSRADLLYAKLQELARQAKFQSYANFMYDVTMVLNQIYNSETDYGTDEVYTKISDLVFGERAVYDPARD